MKRIISIFLLLVLCLCAVSCSGDGEVPDGMKLASGEKDQFCLYVPESWALNANGVAGAYVGETQSSDTGESEGGRIYSLSNVSVMACYDYTTEVSAADDTSADDTAAASKSSQEIDKYWYTCWNTYTENFKNFKIEESGTALTISEKYEAKQYIYTVDAEGGSYRVRMVVTYAGGLIYVITYTAAVEYYDAHTAEVDSIIANFKFKQ